MTAKAASEEALAALHTKVAEVMLNALDAMQPDEIVPPAAFLSAVTKFLADNSITCQVSESEKLSALEQQLARKEARRANVVNLREVSHDECA